MAGADDTRAPRHRARRGVASYRAYCVRVPDESDTDEDGKVKTLCGLYRFWGGTVGYRVLSNPTPNVQYCPNCLGREESG